MFRPLLDALAGLFRPRPVAGRSPDTRFRPGLDLALESRDVPAADCLAWGTHVSAGFVAKVEQVASELGVDPSDLMAIMALETSVRTKIGKRTVTVPTFSPSVRNPGSTATGLIQFTSATAKTLGTSLPALAAMSAEQQLDYVERYFLVKDRGRQPTSLGDLYSVVLTGNASAVGKGKDNQVLLDDSPGSKTRSGYNGNKQFDNDPHDGKITKKEIAAAVQKYLVAGHLPGNCLPLTGTLQLGASALSFSATAGSAWADQVLPFVIFNGGSGPLTFDVETSGRVSYTASGSSPLAPFSEAFYELSYNTGGMQAGTYQDALFVTSNDPQHPLVTVPITITIKASQPQYTGQFTGWVQNTESDSGDQGGAFWDTYGGPATMTVTANPTGGYTLQFSATLKSSVPHDESFDASPSGSLTVSSLTNISFQFPMGDGECVVRGLIAGGTFAGSWNFVQLNSTDTSDSGSGSFDLFLNNP